jgi:hypothetical protein
MMFEQRVQSNDLEIRMFEKVEGALLVLNQRDTAISGARTTRLIPAIAIGHSTCSQNLVRPVN